MRPEEEIASGPISRERPFGVDPEVKSQIGSESKPDDLTKVGDEGPAVINFDQYLVLYPEETQTDIPASTSQQIITKGKEKAHVLGCVIANNFPLVSAIKSFIRRKK